MKWLNKIFKIFKKTEYPDLYEITKQTQDNSNKRLQQMADNDFERNAKLEGHDMYTQWLSGACILVPRPRMCIYMHYGETKWKTEDYSKIRDAEFQRLMTEAKEKHIVPFDAFKIMRDHLNKQKHEH